MAVLTALACVLIPVIAAGIVNAIVFTRGWNSRRDDGSSSASKGPLPLPPGWGIALIWTAVFAALGGAWYAVGVVSLAAAVLLGVIAFCLAYPFLTQGLRADTRRTRVLNVVTLILAAVAAAAVAATRAAAVVLVAPLVAWASYVNLAQAAATCPACSSR